MAVPKRTVRGAPGADRERVAECPSVMARDDATIKLGDVNRPGCVSIVIELTVASSLRSHRFGRGAGRCRSVAFDGSTVVTKRDPV